jgi:hypothetical protein
MKTLLDHIVIYMADGSVKKLSHIVEGVHNMGWKSSPSSRYIHSYHELREHPEMFERVGYGLYRLINSKKPKHPLDMEEIREQISGILQKRGSMSTVQLWKNLTAQGVRITYKQVSHALKYGDFEKCNKSEYVFTKRTKYNNI